MNRPAGRRIGPWVLSATDAGFLITSFGEVGAILSPTPLNLRWRAGYHATGATP